jgi:hypothetical protein
MKKKLLIIGLSILVVLPTVAVLSQTVFSNPVKVYARSADISIGNALNAAQATSSDDRTDILNPDGSLATLPGVDTNSTKITPNGDGTFTYTEKWIVSYATILFNTPDGDLDAGDYALDGNGGYYVRLVPTTQGQFTDEPSTYNISGLAQVFIVPGGTAYYDEFLTAQGAIDDWTPTSKYYGSDFGTLPTGDVVRRQSNAVSYNSLKTVKNATQPSRQEQISTSAIPQEPIDLPNGDGIGYDATSYSGGYSGVSGYSFNQNCGATANLLVFGDAHSSGGYNDTTITGVTYNSVAMTFVRSDVIHNYPLTWRSTIYYLLAPSTGSSYTVTVTFNNSQDTGGGGVVSYSGAAQSGQPDNSNGNSGSSSNPTVNIVTSADNCWVFDVCKAQWSESSCGNTSRWIDSTYDSYGSDTNGVVHPAGTQTMSWTMSGSGYWITSAVSFAPTVVTPVISNSASTYTLNSDNSGSGIVMPNTTYYSNPLGSTTSPTTSGATDAQCEWTLTNTSSMAIDLTCTMPDYSGGGSNSTNSNDGTNGATSFGAKSYFSGQASGSWVVMKSSGSSVGYSNLAANTNIKWGFLELTQTTLGTSVTGSTSIITITATAH